MNFIKRKKFIKNYIGKNITMITDRPLGSVHPRHKNVIYPINFGHAVGIYGEDGRELGCYLLGVTKPVMKITAKVIGVIVHKNDINDRIILAPDGIEFDQAQIANAVHFQEKYYSSEIDAMYQKSCGAVVYRKINQKKEYLLLLQKRSKTWSLPKGHMELNETEEKTALREVFEESGIKVKLIPGFRKEISYNISSIKRKNVVFFLAETDLNPRIRECEIERYIWCDADKAKKVLNSDYIQIIDSAEAYQDIN